MPIFRRRAMRRRGERKPRLAAKVSRLSRELRLRTPETKYAQQTEIFANSSYDGSLRTIIAAPAQGSSDTTRVGDSFRVKDMEFRLIANASVTGPLRVIIFLDKRNFSTQVTDVLESGTIGVANGFNAPNGLMVHDYASKYRILYDKVLHFDVNGRAIQSIVKRFRFKNGLKVEQLAGATTIIRNAVKMVYISGLVSGTTPAVTWQCRTNFYDA